MIKITLDKGEGTAILQLTQEAAICEDTWALVQYIEKTLDEWDGAGITWEWDAGSNSYKMEGRAELVTELAEDIAAAATFDLSRAVIF